MNAAFPPPTVLPVNGISMAVYQQGEGFPVILCHGFPELAYSWRYQIPALAAAGFRVIAPDQRGYGLSDKPEGLDEYHIGKLTGDLAGLLDALELEKAVFCGHDWGGHLVWEMPLLHHERVAGVIGVNTPHRYFRRMGSDPVGWLAEHFSAGNYRLAFLVEGIEAGLTPEVLPRFFDGLFRGRPITYEQYLAAPPAVRNLEWEAIAQLVLAPEPAGRRLLSPEDLQVYVDAFSRGGLTAPINWYRNLVKNSEILAGTPEEIGVPCLMISSEDDIFLPPSCAEGMEQYVADLERRLIPECGHWTQAEKPEELNALLIDWLQRKFG